MKILFINPPYTNFAGIDESAGHMMPLCFGYLAAFARERIENLEFKILDAEAQGCNLEDIRTAVAKFNPNIAALTAPTPALKFVYRIAEIVKQQNRHVHVVLGGIHPTVMPERTIKECRAIDFIVVGEGEETFCQLLLAFKKESNRFSHIEGLWYRQANLIKNTSKRKLIANLDTIPFPARDLYDLRLYRSAPTKKVSDENATPILTSRGCPFNCIHCPSKTIWDRTIRYRSTENVVQEIEICIRKYGLREFNFFDDTFTINRKRVLEICKKIIERRMNIYWVCFARTNAIDEELVKIMKEAGCRKISFGFESGDQRILDLMRKKTTIDMGRKAVQAVRQSRIPVHGSFMLGNIGETEDTIKKTITYAKSLDLDNATFFITTPFPGTDLYKIAKDLGNITPQTPWENFAPLTKASPILVQNLISKYRLIYWQKRAFREFYLRPKYILKKLRLLTSIEGIKTLFEGLRIFLRILKKNI